MALRIGDRVKVTKTGSASFGKTGTVSELAGADGKLEVELDPVVIRALESSLSLTAPPVDPAPRTRRLMMGTEGSSGWPQMIAQAHAAYPFRCGRLSDRWDATAAVAEHAKIGSEPMILVEDWAKSPSTLVAMVKRYQPHVRAIELGNEDFYSYKVVTASGMVEKAGRYARAVVALRSALDAAGLNDVGIVAQLDTGDPGLSNTTDGMWLGSRLADALYAAVPDLHRHVRAWSVHLYVKAARPRVRRRRSPMPPSTAAPPTSRSGSPSTASPQRTGPRSRTRATSLTTGIRPT